MRFRFMGTRRVLAVIFIGCMAATSISAQSPSLDAAHFAALTARFQDALDTLHQREGFPGATAAFILPDGRYEGFAVGMSDREKQTPMGPDTRSMSGSIGKTFVAAVAIGLVQDGKLTLDDPVAKWLKDKPWFERLPNANTITLRMLLTHSAGLMDHVNQKGFADAITKMIASGDRDAYIKPEEMIGFILDKKPLYEPGKGYAYTDTGYLVVGMLIEEVTGETYYDLLQERILDPLALNLTVPTNTRHIPGLTPGYTKKENPFGLPEELFLDGEIRINPASEWTGGGLATNSKDLVRWAKALYEEKALDKPYIKDLVESGFKKDPKGHYGLGVFVRETPMGMTYGHSGWFPGYNASMTYYAERKVAVAIQINRDFDNKSEYVTELAQVVLSALDGK